MNQRAPGEGTSEPTDRDRALAAPESYFSDPREVLALLKAEHRRLDEEIELLRTTGNVDQLELARMKKRKLSLKDEIQMISDRMIPDIIA